MNPSRRQAQLQLEQRMLTFTRVYNAAWIVRHHMHTHNPEYRQRAIDRFWVILIEELKKCEDSEALLYAVADWITSNPLGLPWER